MGSAVLYTRTHIHTGDAQRGVEPVSDDVGTKSTFRSPLYIPVTY